MIAVIGVPGGRGHAWRRVADRAEAEAYWAAWRAYVGDSLETLSSYRARHTLTEREARRARYLDGCRVYRPESEDTADYGTVST